MGAGGHRADAEGPACAGGARLLQAGGGSGRPAEGEGVQEHSVCIFKDKTWVRRERGQGGLTSIRRISMERTVVKKNICRKKSDTSPTTANRQNSWKRTEFRNEQIPHRHKEEKDTLSHQR